LRIEYHNRWPVDGGRAWHEVEERLINQWVWSLLPSTYLNFLSSLQTKACKACLQNLVVSSTSRPSSAETKPSSKVSMPILALQHKQWRLQLKWLLLSFLHEEINPEMDQRARDKAKTLGRWCAQRPIKYYCLQNISAMFVSRNSLSGKLLSKLSCVCLPLEKLINGKYFSVKEKFSLVSRKVFSCKIWEENTFRKLWKI